MEKYCESQIKRIDDKDKIQDNRLNRHSDRLDSIEQTVIAMQKDTSRLEEILEKLEKTIDTLTNAINELKYKPLKKYEQVAMVIVSAIVGFLVSKWF